MGATYTEQAATGKTLREALTSAVREAEAYYGHQEGYSGAINSGSQTASLVDLPARMTFRKFQALLEDAEMFRYDDSADEVRWARQDVAAKKRGAKGRLAKALRSQAKAQKERERFYAKVEKAGFDRYDFDRLVEAYTDKWGGYLAVELRGAEKTQRLNGRRLKRGERLFVFFGYAPC
jgi:hypothetical protein